MRKVVVSAPKLLALIGAITLGFAGMSSASNVSANQTIQKPSTNNSYLVAEDQEQNDNKEEEDKEDSND